MTGLRGGAGRASRTHLKHQRALDDASPDAEHASEKAREEADGWVPDSIERGPLDVTLNVLIVDPALEAPLVHQVVPDAAAARTRGGGEYNI